MSSFSTHVLDAAHGAPAAGVPVALSVRDGGGWAPLASGTTDDDGRWRAPDDAALTAGTDHRIVFDTAAHLGPDAFYPEVAVVFRPATTSRHHHVPLLLSPFSYSTYLGS
ncbi:hydroxyisourate hydrolase [Pseudonocardia nematodicida]|uniref:5-hydroxyisourate hydrolase n=1 Tax=Pseudonocardia nematodicida TaxID=1206997 RepID=A0ABV1K788_9PSEU